MPLCSAMATGRQERHAPGRGDPPPERVPPRAARPQEARRAGGLLRRGDGGPRRGGRRGGPWEQEARRRPERAGHDPGVPEPRERAGAEELVVAAALGGGAEAAVHGRTEEAKAMGTGGARAT